MLIFTKTKNATTVKKNCISGNIASCCCMENIKIMISLILAHVNRDLICNIIH